MLGSRKLLIVLCIVPCILSLVCIGAFAAPAEDLTPSVDIPIETELVEDVVKSPSALAEETFPAQPLLESAYYTYSCSFYQINTNGWSNVLSVAVYDSNGTFISGASGDSATLYRSGASVSNWGYTFGNTFYLVGTTPQTSIEYHQNYHVIVLSSSPTLTDEGGNALNGTLVENSLVPDIADSVFDLGDALITFIMSSWIVMIPLAAWLVVLCIGAIRKLVKGV